MHARRDIPHINKQVNGVCSKHLLDVTIGRVGFYDPEYRS